MPIYEISIRWQ